MQLSANETARTWFVTTGTPPAPDRAETRHIDTRQPHEKGAAELWKDVEKIIELGWFQSAEVQIDNAVARGPATQGQLRQYIVCAQGNIDSAEQKMRTSALVISSPESSAEAKISAADWVRFYIDYIRTDVVRPISKARAAGYRGPSSSVTTYAGNVIAWAEVLVGDTPCAEEKARAARIGSELAKQAEPRGNGRSNDSGAKCEDTATKLWNDVERLIQLGWYQSAEVQADDAMKRVPATQEQLRLYVTCAQGNAYAADEFIKKCGLIIESDRRGTHAAEAREWINFHAGHIRTDVVRPLAKALRAGYAGSIEETVRCAARIIVGAEIALGIIEKQAEAGRADVIALEMAASIRKTI